MCDEKWVWPENFRDVNIYADFVHKFTVGGSFSKAQLIIRADSQYVLWINGKFAGYGQYPDYPFYTVYDSIDITSYIKSGENRMCILGYCQAEESSTYYPGTPGIRFRVECDGEAIAKSGADTLCRQDPCYKSGSVPKISGQLSFGFICNGCNYDGWLTADTDGFDTPECRENSSEPVLRKIKKTVLLDNKPSRLIASGTVKADLSDCETGRRMQQAEWDPENPNGIYMLFDLSEESSGLLTLKTNLKSGAKIDIGFGEHIEDGRVRSYIWPRNFAVEYTAPAGDTEFTHYIKRIGGRYIQVYIYCGRENILSLEATVREVLYPVKDLEKPKGLTPEEEKIYDIGVRTLKLCMHDHYEDTPWREQALYAMDSRNQILCGYYAFGEFTFARESLRLLGLGIRDDGLLELCAPAKIPITIPSFSLVWIVAVYEYMLYSGDIEFVKEMLPIIEKILNAVKSRVSENGLVDRFLELPYWNFYEWSENLDGNPIDRNGNLEPGRYELPLNAFFVAAALSAHKIYEKLNIEKNNWLELARKTKKAINDNLYDEKGFYYNYVMNGSKGGKSQLSTALAVWSGVCPKENYSDILPVLTDETDAVGISLSAQIFRYDALLKVGGQEDFIRQDMNKRWMKMIAKGATSFWETEIGAADFDNAGSLCHGWSALPVYYYRLLSEDKKPVFLPEDIVK